MNDIQEHNHDLEHPYVLAFVIDGEVVDTLRSHKQLGVILLSNPLIVDITNTPNVSIGDGYDETTKTFKDILDD